jgi:hypothetical protein
MSLSSQLSAFCFIGIFISCILLVVFGQVTVRRLRKDPKLKDKLGVEFISGYDIINVASALAMPKWFNDKLKDSPISFLYANHEILYEATKPFDRILAKIFWGVFITSAFFMIVLVLLDKFGVLSD